MAPHQSSSNPTVTATIDYFVDGDRYQRSCVEKYYILDTMFLLEHFPTINVIGSTGNLYNIFFCPATIRCSCPDSTSPCKHMLFIFSILRYDPQPGRTLRVNLGECIRRIQSRRPFETNRLDCRANQLCSIFIHKACASCINATNCPTYVCNECDLLMHHYHVHELSQPLPPRCPLCRRHWNPFPSTSIGGYQNFSTLLNRLGYKVNAPSYCPPARPIDRNYGRPLHVRPPLQHDQPANALPPQGPRPHLVPNSPERPN